MTKTRYVRVFLFDKESYANNPLSRDSKGNKNYYNQDENGDVTETFFLEF